MLDHETSALPLRDEDGAIRADFVERVVRGGYTSFTVFADLPLMLNLYA